MQFRSKAGTICISEKMWLNCKKIYKHYKLANIQLNTVNKVNFRLIVIMSYTLLGLKSRNI